MEKPGGDTYLVAGFGLGGLRCLGRVRRGAVASGSLSDSLSDSETSSGIFLGTGLGAGAAAGANVGLGWDTMIGVGGLGILGGGSTVYTYKLMPVPIITH